MMERMAEASPLFKARAAGFFWLMTILMGSLALFVGGGLGRAANGIATACYAAATLLVYQLLKPVNRRLSLLAALFSLVGCALGVLLMFHLASSRINPLVFFGLHCLLVGYLIIRSTFLPRIVGGVMVIAGLGWLTFLWPPLAKYLSPYNLAPGILGEASLTLWLLVVGVNVPRWKEQARITRGS